MTKFKQRLKVIGVFMCNWFLFSFIELVAFHNISKDEVLALFYADDFYQKTLNLPITLINSSREKVIKLFEAYLESIR